MRTKPLENEPADDARPARHMGSEYMDARSYLDQRARQRRVAPSDETWHGSNESHFIDSLASER